MVKRSRSEEGEELPNKRSKPNRPDNLSRLSDELLLNIFSYLSVSDLTVCQRLSHKLHDITVDSQIWKEAYYNRFVRPRAMRVPRLRHTPATKELTFSSPDAVWLDDENLVEAGNETNWKQQFKLRHNWSTGSCIASEVPLATDATDPAHVQMRDGIVYTANSRGGLRAWSPGGLELQGHLAFQEGCWPNCLTLAIPTASERQQVIVGFDSDDSISFIIYEYDKQRHTFKQLYSHAGAAVHAIACCEPYLATFRADCPSFLSIYKMELGSQTPLKPVDTFLAYTTPSPVSLGIRSGAKHTVISVAYTMSSVFSGWTAALQEIWLTPDGDFLGLHRAAAPLLLRSAMSVPPRMEMACQPTSISYTHPYLLFSHPDNTLTLFRVTSTPDSTAISKGQRLWGHTSSVAGSHIGGRGRAVSISSRGNEIRIWELEGTLPARSLPRPVRSVQIQPGRKEASKARPNNGPTQFDPQDHDWEHALRRLRNPEDPDVMQGWIGSDEERVVVLRERAGRQYLVVFDFS
ncbi:hypothetical protein EJ06DRAFT_532551 [Trichodelitschia bisporula]|uniref:F-box domain-containing protein n=1 Tax=Trichodelitschia bisporula TaxID=703511 RepID=A0A6G1HQQ7_9PEZI|nr:hypothetical protein EJ06DRAFT_532551 [Trichodelitschia bisporula]